MIVIEKGDVLGIKLNTHVREDHINTFVSKIEKLLDVKILVIPHVIELEVIRNEKT